MKKNHTHANLFANFTFFKTQKKIILLICLLLVTSNLYAQEKLTVKDFTEDGILYPKSVYGVNWMKDGGFFTRIKDNKIVKFDVNQMKEVEVIFDGTKYNKGARINGYTFVSNEEKILIEYDRKSVFRRSYTAQYYLFDRTKKSIDKISKKDKQSYATLSPNGEKIAFVYANNLYYVDISTTPFIEVQVTKDGKFNEIINGSSDWVYEEEFSITKAFDWSLDSKTLAYIKFNESNVKEYNMQMWDAKDLYPEDRRYKYPKAGEDNAKVSIHLYDVATDVIDNIKLNEEFEYIPRINWTPKTNILSIVTMNRLQNKLSIIHIDKTTKTSKTALILEEKTYVDLDFLGDPNYISENYFLMASEETGFKHLSLYDYDGNKINTITNGEWSVTEVVKVTDEKKPWIYFISNEMGAIERQLYKITLKGKKKQILTPEKGVHRVNVSTDAQYFLDYYSNHTSPLQVSLYTTNPLVKKKVLEDNSAFKETLKKYDLPEKEFFKLKMSHGQSLNAYFLKPKSFDSNKKYPLMIFQYSGPRSQNVMNKFGDRGFHYMLTQANYIVAVIDPRGTGGRGKEFAAQTYKKLGKLEAEDLIETAQKLGSYFYIDKNRIGIWGWSYGGYMSSLAAFRGAKTFNLAIAVAPVSNWKYYDTIYTERYLQTPQLNKKGYEDNSPVNYAKDYRGKYLLIHGTGDDNVHFQNALILQQALIMANKQFSSFYYPNLAHSLYEGNSHTHLYTMMFNYVKQNL